MKQKHFMDIQRMTPAFVSGFDKGDHIVIQEKIDGANFSIRYDKENNCVASFSRKHLLTLENNLRGAFEWAQQLDVNLVKSILGDNLVLFGEWLVPHTVKYPEDKYHKAYFYDVYDTEAQLYLPQLAVREIVKDLNLTYVPVFFDGNFTDWDDVMKHLGKTEMGAEFGEGIVVKNQTQLNSPNTRLPFYVKIVCKEFAEVKPVKKRLPISKEELEERQRKQELAESIVTPARVNKLVHKLIDDGIIPEDWDAKSMSTIAKNIAPVVYQDCLKEEKDTVQEIGEGFGKLANKIAMGIVRQTLSEKEKLIFNG